MTLTLKEAINATQTTVDVNGTDTLSNGDLYSIEDEQVFIVAASAGDIQPGQTAWQRINVQRGQLGTTEVAHAAGTALTAVATPLGVQTISLLGPFPVTYQSSGIATAAGTLLTTLDAGVLLLKPMLMTTAYFEVSGGANPTSIALQIAVGATNVAVINYDPENQAVSSISEIEGNFDVGGVTHLNVLTSACFTTQATQLRLRVTGTLVAGAGDVYALIATPA